MDQICFGYAGTLRRKITNVVVLIVDRFNAINIFTLLPSSPLPTLLAPHGRALHRNMKNGQGDKH